MAILLADVLGVLRGVQLSDLMRETIPQLRFYTRFQGRILWPSVRPIMEGNFQPGEDGVQKIIRDYMVARNAPPGSAPPQRPQADLDRELAWRIVRSTYTGEDPLEGAPPTTTSGVGLPIPNMSGRAARALLAWAESEDCPPAVFDRDIVPILASLSTTARAD